jgi:hypothetical protein
VWKHCTLVSPYLNNPAPRHVDTSCHTRRERLIRNIAVVLDELAAAILAGGV